MGVVVEGKVLCVVLGARFWERFGSGRRTLRGWFGEGFVVSVIRG